MEKFARLIRMTILALTMVVCTFCATTTASATEIDAKLQQSELTQVGSKPAPFKIAIKQVVKEGNRIKRVVISFPKLKKGHYIYFNIYRTNRMDSISGSWVPEYGGDCFEGWSEQWVGKSEYIIDLDNYYFTPGRWYVEAYEFNANDNGYYNDPNVPYPRKRINYTSDVSNVLALDVSMTADVSSVVKATSVELKMNCNKATGYEVYRKIEKKYLKLKRVAGGYYKDSGLTSNTTYQYRVRPYYYDEDENTYIYGEYTDYETTTSGSPLKLKINANGKKVKLTWNKVSGAKKYEVYRKVIHSESSSIKAGQYNGYEGYKKIASLSKSKKSYTDKPTANCSYQYLVKAVGSGKKPLEISDAKDISLRFGAPVIYNQYTNAAGRQVIEWKSVYGAKGYILQKYDASINTWVDFVTNISASATSYTLPAVDMKKSASESYRLCAKGSGNVRSFTTEVQAKACLAAVNSVSAVQVANGIKVSWSAVPGATYYKVYRSYPNYLIKNETTGCYESSSLEAVLEYKNVTTPVEGETEPGGIKKYYPNYSYATSIIKGTSVLDYDGVVYDNIDWWRYTWVNNDGYYYTKDAVSEYYDIGNCKPRKVGPRLGQTYQYYVVAYFDAELQKDDELYYIYNINDKTLNPIECIKYEDNISSVGCKKLAKITYTNVKAPSKGNIKSIASKKKKQAVITISAQKDVTEYKIYRSTKKNKGFKLIANVHSNKYTDKKLTSGKTYYYKVVPVKSNEIGADVPGAASKVKKVKVK